MAFPRVAWKNVLSLMTIRVQNADTDMWAALDYPKAHLYHPWHASRPFWFESDEITITDKNNKIQWKEAGVLKTVTLSGTNAAPKKYRPINLAAHIQTKLNAYGGVRTFAVSYIPTSGASTVPGLISIVADAAVEWIGKDGAGTYSNQIWSTIAADLSAGSVTSTTIGSGFSGFKGSGERFYLVGTEILRVKLGAGADTSIPLNVAGSYRANELADFINVKINDTLNTTQIYFFWDFDSGKWAIKNQTGSTLTIYSINSDALSTAAPILGITENMVLATSAAAWTKAATVARHRLMSLVFDAGTGYVISDQVNNVFAMWAPNLSAQAVVTLYLHGTNLGSESSPAGWAGASIVVPLTNPKAIDPEDTSSPWIAGDDETLFSDYVESFNYRYMSLHIEDPTLDPTLPVAIDGIFLGPFETIECHPLYADEEYGIEDTSERIMGDARNAAGNIKPKGDTVTLTLPEIDGTGKNTMQRLFAHCRVLGLPFLWMEELGIDVVSEFQKTKWMLFADDLTIKEIEPTGEKYTTNRFTLVEGG